MATFTVTLPNTNIDTLAGKAGGDTYTINGGTLVIDQDTRYGANASSTAAFGTVAISTTLGGIVDVDGRAVRWIPYDTGSGNVPAGGTVITQGGASGKLICVASAINVAPTAPAAAMPASGFIKVKQVSGSFAAGALTGIGASATGADVVAPISLVGDEAGQFAVPRLGLGRFRGAWYDVGTTSGVNTTDYQLPTQGELFWLAGVQVETAAGSGVYAWWPCVGTLAAAAGNIGPEEIRGSVCWISTAGVLRLGRDLSGNTTGYTPGAGRKIRIPNILTANCTTAARAANVVPNTTLATRFEFATTASGALEFDVCSLNWHPNIDQGYSLAMTDVVVAEAMILKEIPTAPSLLRVCVGVTGNTGQTAVFVNQCYAGGSAVDVVAARAVTGATTYCYRFSGASNWNLTRVVARTIAARSVTNCYSFAVEYANGVLLEDCVQIGGVNTYVNVAEDVTFKNLAHVDTVAGTTGITTAVSAMLVTGFSKNVLIDGFSFGGLANVHPYVAIVSVAACRNVKLRQIGTRAAPLSCGSANATAHVLAGATSNSTLGVTVQRVYTSDMRTGFTTFDNSTERVVIENCAGNYADTQTVPMGRSTLRAFGGTLPSTAQNAVYGSIWNDCFTSTTAGRLVLLMNEPTSAEAAQVTLENGAAYTATGGLSMPVIGMRATFEMPYFMLGHTGFQNAVAVMGGGTIGNYTLEFQYNTGAGFGAWTALTGANLAAVGAFPSTGVKLRVRITTSTTNSTAITSLYMLTTSTTTAQETQLFPLDTNTITFTGLPTGTDVVVLTAGTDTILDQRDANPTSSYAFVYSGAHTVDVGFIKPGFVPFYIRGLSLTTADSSIPVALTADRNYS